MSVPDVFRHKHIFSFRKENIWLSHPPLRLRKQGINGSRVQTVNLVLEQQSRKGGGVGGEGG